MGVGKTGMNQYRDPISVWKVYLPFEYDRAKYIKNCFRTGTVTLINDNAEIKHGVRIGRMALQFVEFPADINSFGSEVICATLPYSGDIRVVDVYSSKLEFFEQGEDQIKLSKGKSGEYAEVFIDGQNGRVNISVDSDDNKGELSISVTNVNRSAKMSVLVNGELMVVNDGKTTVQSSQEIQLEQYDGNEEEEKTFVNIKKDEVRIESKKILLNESDEPVVLGNKLKDLLTKLLDQLGKESAGPYPLLGNSFYTNLKQELDKFLSELSFVK